MMSEEAKRKRREYMRAWHNKPENKDKQQEYQARYWERKAQREQEKRGVFNE